MADIYFRPDGANRFQIRSAAGLTLPSAWLDQEFNRIYSYMNTIEGGGATTGSEWATVQVEATKVSSTSFSVEGDYSGVFEILRAIRFKDDSDVYTLSHIKAVSYVGGTNLTTVTVYDAVVPEEISAIDVGLIGSEAQPIPSFSYRTRTSGYTIGASDQIVLVDDGTVGNLTKTWDDGATGGDETSYYALWITLPVASDMPGKLLCIKKIGGGYRTIVASTATRTDTTVGDVTTHTYSYVFQIYGDTDAKNRVTLKGVGDCYWLFSNGNRWYELTPEASETVKGIVKLANADEMTLSAQQIADDESLSRTLAVSPYQLDSHYLRNDGSNISFSSNFIYKTPTSTNGSAAYLDGTDIVVPSGVGVVIPMGRGDDGAAINTQVETKQLYRISQLEVSNKTKMLFLVYNPTTKEISFRSFFSKDVIYGYDNHIIRQTYPQWSNECIWFNYRWNQWFYSSDNATNWTAFYGVILCEYSGNGTSVTAVYTRSAAGLATRDEIAGIRRDFIVGQWSGGQAGYRIWNSRLLEQWGIVQEGVSLYLPYTGADTYAVFSGVRLGNNRGGWSQNVESKTNSYIHFTYGFGDRGGPSGGGSGWWYTIGY